MPAKAKAEKQYYVLKSHPDKALHGYVCKVVESKGHEALVEFGLSIGNKSTSKTRALVSMRNLRPL